MLKNQFLLEGPGDLSVEKILPSYLCINVQRYLSHYSIFMLSVYVFTFAAFNECNATTLPCVNDGLCIDAVGHYVCKCFIEDIEVYYGKTCQRGINADIYKKCNSICSCNDALTNLVFAGK